jgi:hypothetical protein
MPTLAAYYFSNLKYFCDLSICRALRILYLLNMQALLGHSIQVVITLPYLEQNINFSSNIYNSIAEI